MAVPRIDSVSVALRVYPEPREPDQDSSSNKRRELPHSLIVLDTETRTDHSQRLMFGCWRYIEFGQCLEEGLFYADDLSPRERNMLEHYARTYRADTIDKGEPVLQLLPLQEFLEGLYVECCKTRSVVAGFNLPFDLARVAFNAVPARKRYLGGFALELWSYTDGSGNRIQHPYRPRVAIKHIDSKRALKGFTSCDEIDSADRIPEGSPDGQPQDGYIFRGHFLDLRTLAFALTDRGYTLESACEDFGVEHPKQKVREHGKLTKQYIDYCRRDVLATAELYEKLIEEYEKHPIHLQATKAYSPASIGKSYLRAMGICPVLERR